MAKCWLWMFILNRDLPPMIFDGGCMTTNNVALHVKLCITKCGSGLAIYCGSNHVLSNWTYLWLRHNCSWKWVLFRSEWFESNDCASNGSATSKQFDRPPIIIDKLTRADMIITVNLPSSMYSPSINRGQHLVYFVTVHYYLNNKNDTSKSTMPTPSQSMARSNGPVSHQRRDTANIWRRRSIHDRVVSPANI